MTQKTGTPHDDQVEDDAIDEHDSAHINQPLPHVGRPLDGSQFHDVVEEQIYAEQRVAPKNRKDQTDPRGEDGKT